METDYERMVRIAREAMRGGGVPLPFPDPRLGPAAMPTLVPDPRLSAQYFTPSEQIGIEGTAVDENGMPVDNRYLAKPFTGPPLKPLQEPFRKKPPVKREGLY